MTIDLVSDGCSASRQAIARACWSALWTKIAGCLLLHPAARREHLTIPIRDSRWAGVAGPDPVHLDRGRAVGGITPVPAGQIETGPGPLAGRAVSCRGGPPRIPKVEEKPWFTGLPGLAAPAAGLPAAGAEPGELSGSSSSLLGWVYGWRVAAAGRPPLPGLTPPSLPVGCASSTSRASSTSPARGAMGGLRSRPLAGCSCSARPTS